MTTRPGGDEKVSRKLNEIMGLRNIQYTSLRSLVGTASPKSLQPIGQNGRTLFAVFLTPRGKMGRYTVASERQDCE